MGMAGRCHLLGHFRMTRSEGPSRQVSAGTDLSCRRGQSRRGWRPVCFVSSRPLPGETECPQEWGAGLRWGDSPSQPAPNGGTPTPGPGNPTNALDFCPSSYPTLRREAGAGGLPCWKGNWGRARKAAEDLDTQPAPPAGPRGAGGTGQAQLLHPGGRAGCGVHAHA